MRPATDVLFKEFTCEENITLYGKEVFSITKLQMNAHKTLKMNFDEASCQIGYLDTECYLYVKMYQLWIDKFCNVRTNDRLKSLELIEVADSWRTTSSSSLITCTFLSQSLNNPVHNDVFRLNYGL